MSNLSTIEARDCEILIDDDEDMICARCKEHAAPSRCADCNEYFGSNCCGAGDLYE